MSWWKRDKPPVIPPYVPVVVETKPKPEPGIIVDEVDTSDMTKTGIHRAWDRLSGRTK